MSKLSNYLRDHCRRAGISQEEVAFLLGHGGGKGAARDKQLMHEPTLRTIMAYEVVFRASLKELFAGMYRKVEEETMKRAKKLLHRLPMESTSEEKWRTLLAIVEPPEDDLHFEPIARP